MNKEKEIIQELNVVFKKRGWKLLPENNTPSINCWNTKWVYEKVGVVIIHRFMMTYSKYINKFTSKELDEFVMKFIEDICRKYKIKKIWFCNNGDDWNTNEIKINYEKL